MAKPESYSDWVDLRITDNIPGPLSFQNAQVSWGKFYKYNDENDEISPQQVDSIVINKGGQTDICACGRQASASGTTGSVDVMDQSQNRRVCTLSWNCPYTGSNDLEVLNQDDGYTVKLGNWPPRGALGTVPVNVQPS